MRSTLLNIDKLAHKAKQTNLLTINESQIIDQSKSPSEIIKVIKNKSKISQSFIEKLYDRSFPKIGSKHDSNRTGIGYLSDKSDINYTVINGLSDIITINKVWQKYKSDTVEKQTVLDFGSGSGRLLRFADEFGDNIELFGTDVNPKAINWLQSSMKNTTLDVIDNDKKQIKFQVKFDLIYAWSIFTHFNETEHKIWLDNFLKILKPGGLALLTFNSESNFETFINSKERLQKIGIDKDGLMEIKKQFHEAGFTFFKRYNFDESKIYGIDAKSFGQTYISKKYINDNWNKSFEVLGFEVGVLNWQDIVVLKKRYD